MVLAVVYLIFVIVPIPEVLNPSSPPDPAGFSVLGIISREGLDGAATKRWDKESFSVLKLVKHWKMFFFFTAVTPAWPNGIVIESNYLSVVIFFSAHV
jgi:hypothetical protein